MCVLEFIDIEKLNKITSFEHSVYAVCYKCFEINIKFMIHPANKLQNNGDKWCTVLINVSSFVFLTKFSNGENFVDGMTMDEV